MALALTFAGKNQTTVALACVSGILHNLFGRDHSLRIAPCFMKKPRFESGRLENTSIRHYILMEWNGGL
jgi:hypothetical protein